MKFLVWTALFLAGFGYWWSGERRKPAKRWTEQDNTDTADAVERMFNR